jgi:hypothetical protein
VLILSARDKQVLDWLIAQVGEEPVRAVCGQLPGKCLPYVSNPAKVLGLYPPPDLQLASSQDEVKRHISLMKELLASGRKS